jgi:multidrug efflux pump subunit AcrB
MNGFNLSALAVHERAVTLFFDNRDCSRRQLRILKLGRARDPAFTIKVLSVAAAWPGATAQEMQDLVKDPLEKRLHALRWYDHVDTFTRPGMVFMTVSPKDNTPPDAVQRSSIRPARNSVMRRNILREVR